MGNIYINRNQIGAVVGSQPFGGEGISGTGPKAGGPNYLPRLQEHPLPCLAQETGPEIDRDTLQLAIDALEISAHADISSAADLPGPTGESNRLLSHPRGAILCLGPTIDAAAQAGTALDAGCAAVMVTPGAPTRRDEFHVGPKGWLPSTASRLRNRLRSCTGWARWLSGRNLRPCGAIE